MRKRVRLLAFAPRKLVLNHFEEVGRATMKRKRIHLVYYARSKKQYRSATSRRSDSSTIAAIGTSTAGAICATTCARFPSIQSGVFAFWMRRREVSTKTLDDYLGTGYGIVRGKDVTWAKLRFSAERARWVAAEAWHPEQRGVMRRMGVIRWSCRISTIGSCCWKS